MEAKTIQKYKKYTLSQLKSKATKVFNKYIRERDKGKQCCSCNSYNIENACHFYSAGSHPGLKYNEDNVHGGCVHCNKFLSGNLNEYRKKLHFIIGEERLKKLDDLAAYYKRNGYKTDRFYLIEIIEKYK